MRFAATGILINIHTVSGSAGGAGGTGGTGGTGANYFGNGGVGGIGGAGGVGASFAAAATLTNSGTISGGNGGAGGAGGAGRTNNGTGGANGAGGIGITFAGGGTLINSGTISGGTNGDGSGIALGASFSGNSDALVNLGSGVINGGVSMTGSNNSVTLFTGSVIDGDLNMGADTQSLLTLDGAGNSVLSSAVTGTTTFAGGLTKQGAGIWTIDSTLNVSSVTISAGTLELASATGFAAGSASSVTVASAATLLISQSNQVNNNAKVTLSGGTITRGRGVSEVFGNLNLTQASFLDFGTGTAGTITFGTYTPSSLLTINNFDLGNTLVFGSDLRSTINNSSFFTFTNGGIASSSWNEGTSTFTITAIPEPSAYVAAIGLLALMLWPVRCRLRGKVS
jgi:hypothetical protein